MLKHSHHNIQTAIILIVSLFAISAKAQTEIGRDSLLNYSLMFRGMSRNDITIPVNYDKSKSPRNDSKLILPVVERIMKEPLSSFTFLDEVSKLSGADFSTLLNKFSALLNHKVVDSNKISRLRQFTFDELIKEVKKFVKQGTRAKRRVDTILSKEQRDFLRSNLLSVIGEDDFDDNNSDIFKFNVARDSSIKTSMRAIDLLDNDTLKKFVDEKIYSVRYLYQLYEDLKTNIGNFGEDGGEEIDNDNVKGQFIFYYDEDGIRIAIGGKGKNLYKGKFNFIIDLGGNDDYEIESGDIFSENNFSCIFDFGGNDIYGATDNYSLAGAAFSANVIFDKSGDDVYAGKSVSLGSAVCGIGILYDEDGNDTYRANQFSTGAASFGIGLLIDRNGNDVYLANSYSQGFGMTEGIGAIIDDKGNDSYLIDARSLDIGRYEDHYISMSQGYGLGLRPYYAGGIGLIIEGEGNDIYNADIFGQGGAYWYSLGCIADKTGHDKYNSYQYSQGAGIHLAVGLLQDDDGWDFYSSNGVSQGCGHDFGFGLLDDRKGNDNYSAYSLSQGAGNANGIGVFIDESGRDGYLNKEPGNSRGYGNSRREYGSIGVFIDGAGDDFYSNRSDSVIQNSSVWGVMNDFYLMDLPSQVSGNNFKIEVDSSKDYSRDEYFIMAKTIEPRFSKWQEFGFRKLIEDSLQTPQYILKYLDTDDHRAALVLRNVSQRIYNTMGNFLSDKLMLYNTSMRPGEVFNENEVAFICYLFGETRNPAGKEQLLNLTYSDNIRIRDAAVNALGKIPVDSSETEFINKVSQRLREMASENSPNKLFNKDLAYAFKNYNNLDNIATLFNMMNNDYYGVRFTAAEALQKFGDEYLNYLSDEKLYEAASEPDWFRSFLNSILNISESGFKNLFTRILSVKNPDDDMTILNYEDLLKNYNKGVSPDFIAWDKEMTVFLQSKSILKVK